MSRRIQKIVLWSIFQSQKLIRLELKNNNNLLKSSFGFMSHKKIPVRSFLKFISVDNTQSRMIFTEKYVRTIVWVPYTLSRHT